jgi:SOUL heme-binding protein
MNALMNTAADAAPPAMHRRSLMLALLCLPALSMAIEEPAFELTGKLGDIEIRRMAPYTVAEVRVPGPAGEAGNQAFPILAGYIFGKNKGEKKFAMTAPVIQTAAPPMKMAMTAPVTQSATADGFVVQFVLPNGVTPATAPDPLDERVRLREVPETTLGVVVYSGTWSQANYDEHLQKLKTALTSAGLAWTGEPVFSRYNGPWTPWFMRRNEIWLNLQPGAAPR